MENIQEQLEKWANDAVAVYNRLAELENGPSYYTQSDLTKITENGKVEVLIAGINPGSGGTYESQKANPSWGIHNGMDGQHLLMGNFAKSAEGKPNWEYHNKWLYFRGLKEYTKSIGDGHLLDDEEKFVLTNASFFATVNASELPEKLLIETLPCTIQLINIIKPKRIIFLSGRRSFARLSAIAEKWSDSEHFEFTYKELMGNILIGKFNGIPCYGVPHPAYKSTLEKQLVSKCLSYLFEHDSIEIDPQEAINYCKTELYNFESKGAELELMKHLLSNNTGLQWWVYKKYDLGVSFNDKTNRIGIESWFIDEDGQKYLQPYITVWNKKCFEPYRTDLERLFPDCTISSHESKNRLYLELPKIMSNSNDDIADKMNHYSKIMKDLTDRIK